MAWLPRGAACSGVLQWMVVGMVLLAGAESAHGQRLRWRRVRGNKNPGGAVYEVSNNLVHVPQSVGVTMVRYTGKRWMNWVVGVIVGILVGCILPGCKEDLSSSLPTAAENSATGASHGREDSTGTQHHDSAGTPTPKGVPDQYRFPDRVVTGMTQVRELYQAGNLTIAEGAILSAPGPLTVHCTGKLTLNGRIRSGGDLILIASGGLDYGPQALVEPDGNFILVSSPELVPTPGEINATLEQLEREGSVIGVGIAPPGGPRSRPGPTAPPLKGAQTQQFGPVWLPPFILPAGWSVHVDVWGQLNVGSPQGGAMTYTLPDGRPGQAAIGCTARGRDGGRGGSIVLHAQRLEFHGDVTINIGSGGPGGNATALNCCPARAEGGRGGQPGRFRFSAWAIGLITGMEIRGPLTINLGNGGDGGDAYASGRDGAGGCPGEDGCSATAIGGDGGSLVGRVVYSGAIRGLGNITINGGRGGNGGTAEAFGGKGGDGNPCCDAGNGGHAEARGGNGGHYRVVVPAPIAKGSGFWGGDGGDATARGGDGGNGGSCCRGVPGGPGQGGNGGRGGNADAFGGSGGVGHNGNGDPGTPGGAAGDGGSGGNGNPPGSGGAGGLGTNVPNGQNGANGNPCQ